MLIGGEINENDKISSLCHWGNVKNIFLSSCSRSGLACPDLCQQLSCFRSEAQNPSVQCLSSSVSGCRCDTSSRNYPSWECENPWHSHTGEPRYRILCPLLHVAKIWCPEWILGLLEENGSNPRGQNLLFDQNLTKIKNTEVAKNSPKNGLCLSETNQTMTVPSEMGIAVFP